MQGRQESENIHILYPYYIREAAKKSSFFSGPDHKEGGGVRARPLKKKELFFVAVEKLNIFC